MNPEKVQETKLNSKAAEYTPTFVNQSGLHYAGMEGERIVGGRSRSSSFASAKEPRRRSQSLSIQLEARRPILRVKVSNFSPDFKKSEFVELINTHFSDVRSIDFQPRYNEKGRLYGFITFSSALSYDECIKMKTFRFGNDELRIEPGQDKGSMPTSTTLVISSLPLNITEEQFYSWISLQNIKPLSFTFIYTKLVPKSHHSPLVFSGSVYIQYRNIEDAGIAWGYMKDDIIANNKISVSFKKRQDKHELDPENNTVFLSSIAKQLWEQLTTFKATYLHNRSAPCPALVFPNDLSSLEKSIVFTYTEKLGLCHYTQGEGDKKHILISTTPPCAPVSQKANQNKMGGRSSRSSSISGDNEEINIRRPRRMSCPDFGNDFMSVRSFARNGNINNGNHVALGPSGDSIGFNYHRTLQ